MADSKFWNVSAIHKKEVDGKECGGEGALKHAGYAEDGDLLYCYECVKCGECFELITSGNRLAVRAARKNLLREQEQATPPLTPNSTLPRTRELIKSVYKELKTDPFYLNLRVLKDAKRKPR